MKDAGLQPSDIKKILLVGGSTRMPSVQNAVRNYFKEEPFKGINPDESVALGAAIQAGVLSGDLKDMILLDVTPLSLGIETLGEVMTRIIDRNTTIPTKKSQVFSTAADGQTTVEVHVLQGEREFARDNKSLGRFVLDGIASAPRGLPQIEVTFDIDANGIVNVTAIDKGTNRKQHITITATTNLTDDEIARAVHEAEAHAEEDKKRKEAVDTKNSADSLVYQAEKMLKENEAQIGDLKPEIEEKIELLKKSIAADNLDGMKSDSEALQQAIYKAGEQIYKQTEQTAGPQSEDGGAESGPGGTYEADFKDAGGDPE